MTDFTRSRPGGWPPGSPVANGEITALDTKLAKALNRFGGTISVGSGGDDGVVTIGASAMIKVPWGAGATIPTVWFRGGKLLLDTDGTHFATVKGAAFFMTVEGTSNIAFSGTSSMTFGTGTSATWGASSTVTVHGSYVTDGLMQMNSGAEQVFESGSSLVLKDQYPLLDGAHPARTQHVRYPLGGVVPLGGAAYAATSDGLSSPTPSTSGSAMVIMLPPPWDGATLASITTYFTPKSAGRDGNLPAIPQSVSLYKRQVTAGTPIGAATLVASGSYVPASYAAYIVGNVLALTFLVAEVIDRAAYEYLLVIVDESSTHSIGGTTFHQVVMNYTVADLRPQ